MKTLIAIAVLCQAVTAVEAQNLKPYWVIETNNNKKDHTILRVYDVEDALIHEEIINGRALNILLRKDRKRINKKVKEILSHETTASGKKR